jgi:uncharacterized protein YjbJ (UPF0337 family)
MSDAEELKGRAKEALGDLTDDKDLKREGKLDKASARVKKKIDEAKDRIEGRDEAEPTR